MGKEIPELRFRLEHSFVVKPALTIDGGPQDGLLMGQNSPRDTFDAVLLGKKAEAPHENVWMDIRGAHVVYVMGKRRSGKSYTLGAIAEGLVADSWIRQGEQSPAVLVLDTMNVFLTMPFSVHETVPSSDSAAREQRKWKLPNDRTRLTLYAPPIQEMPTELNVRPITIKASDLEPEEWCGLFDVDPFVDPMGHFITSLHAKLTVEGIVDIVTGERTDAVGEFTIEDMLYAIARDRELNDFARDTRDAIRRRLETLRRTPIFGANGLDVHELFVPGKLSVLLLRDLEPEMRSVMVSLIVKRMMRLRGAAEQHERMATVHLAKAERLAESKSDEAEHEREAGKLCLERAADGLPRCWLMIDEAHNYIPAHQSVPSRRPLKKYVDEGRNLGLSIVVATQQPSGLDRSIQRNADMLLVHALSHRDDIQAALGMVNTAIPEDIVVDGRVTLSGSRAFENVIRRLPVGYAMASTDRANRLFPMKVRPRLTVHGGADY